MSDVSPSKAPPRIADATGGMEQAPLVYALVHALDRSITGEMVFRAPDGQAHTVTFFEGAPVRVLPGTEGDRIGEDLVAMDQLTEDALEDALLRAHSSRRRLGELLVQAGSVDPDALTQALTLQTAKRLGPLANLPGDSTFSLYFSARAEPEPHAPWAPLDMLLAAIRAWEDRSRLRGTLRWLADKRLRLSAETNLEELMLTSREREAVALMRRESPSLRALYASVGKGLSSLLYMLAVTRQFTFTEAKGAPMGRRRESDLIRQAVQVAVPIAPVIASAPDSSSGEEDGEAEARPASSKPPAAQVAPPPAAYSPPPAQVPLAPPPPPPTYQAPPAPVAHAPPPPPPYQAPPPPAPVAWGASAAATNVPAEVAPLKRRVSVPNLQQVGAAVAVSVVPPAASSSPVLPDANRADGGAPLRAPPRPSFGPPRAPGAPPLGVRADAASAFGAASVSLDLRLAEEAARRHDFETADSILRERCSDEDSAQPEFQALAAWVKANLNKHDLNTPLNDLTFLLMAHATCEAGLYYRGLLLKRSGKEKAALRDLVVLAKQNPNHMAALSEIKLLRESMKT